jgi:hypothetical protein
MVWMLLENRVFWRLVEKVMVVDRGSSVAVCQMDQIDLLSELSEARLQRMAAAPAPPSFGAGSGSTAAAGGCWGWYCP